MNNSNLKTFSSKQLIAKLFNDFSPNSSSWVASAYEWIGEAVQGIGFQANSEVKTHKICIEKHYGVIPCEVESIIAVKYNGARLPLGRDLSGYGIIDWSKQSKKAVSNEDINDLIKYNKLLLVQQAYYAELLEAGYVPTDTICVNQMALIEDTVAKIDTLVGNFTLGNIGNNYDFNYYNIQNNAIITSFEEGEIYVIANSMFVDSDGFPLILDTFKYKEAVEWYCLYKMLLKGYKHPVIKDWKEAYQLWEKYRGQAANEAKMPTLDQMEDFRNMWTAPVESRYVWQNFGIAAEQRISEFR
jgi:hypothetical protein